MGISACLRAGREAITARWPEIASRPVFTLAHLSDWHATTLRGARVGELATKRFWGWQSWMRGRRRRHRPEVLAALCDDVRSQAPDHVVVTGDLTNVALHQEFEQAAATLRALGDPSWVTVVPGNHDAYVSVAPDRGLDHWAAYLLSDDAGGRLSPRRGDYPVVRIRGSVAIVGLCSAEPTPLFMASGNLGAEQLTRLERVLAELGQRGLARVVALHHPPTDDGIGWRRQLRDWRALQAVLHRTGAELVVHGHRHRSWLGTLDPAAGSIPVAGVRSASDVGDREDRRAQYHLYRIERGRPVGVEVRGYDPATGGVQPEGDLVLGG